MPDKKDEKYMRRCLELALKGLGQTSPNPMVGSVIVADDKIIGEGFHTRAGEPHAEVNAIRSVKEGRRLKKSTLYVNLEPCSHHGKTPPCADLIVKHQIPRVVIGSRDPFPEVSGNGIKKLKEAGTEVVEDVLKEESDDLNRRFITFHTKKRPYVILKWAQTRDGFIDVARQEHEGERPVWITNDLSRKIVHKWRAEEDAILVGTNTALMDNPRLNIRDWFGKDPLRLVVDRTLRLPGHLSLFDGRVPTVVFTEKEQPGSPNLHFRKIDFTNLPVAILEELYSMNMQSVIVEGGAKLLGSFIQAGTWDEARVFTGTQFFENGVKAPEIKGDIVDHQLVDGCVLELIKPIR